MDSQDVTNVILAVVGFLVTTLFTMAASKIKDMQTHLNGTYKEVNDLKLLVASDYVKKSELSSMFKEISQKLDKLEDLEIGMVKHYATKADLKGLGDSLGGKLDRIIQDMKLKVDRSNLPPKCANGFLKED
jgi:hypothetical protein